jgi:sugar phosphate permease
MCIPECSKRGTSGKAVAFVLTFLAYMGYHLSRKSYSVVKASLAPKTPSANNTGTSILSIHPYTYLVCFMMTQLEIGWEPFSCVGCDTDTLLLSAVDSVFLGSYALALFAVGAVAHRYSLKVLFLSFASVHRITD